MLAAKDAAESKLKADMASWKLIYQNGVKAEADRERRRQEKLQARKKAQQMLKEQMEADRMHRKHYLEYSYDSVCASGSKCMRGMEFLSNIREVK